MLPRLKMKSFKTTGISYFVIELHAKMAEASNKGNLTNEKPYLVVSALKNALKYKMKTELSSILKPLKRVKASPSFFHFSPA